MKKITLSLLAIISFSTIITSCKKGEEDPAFTILSRKARVSGEWKITSFSETSTSSIIPYSNFTTIPVAGVAYSTANETSHDGATLTISSTSPGVNNVLTTTVQKGTVNEHTYVIEKNGKWTSFMKTTITVTETLKDFLEKTYTKATTTISEITTSGTWDFLSGMGDDYERKERIMLSTNAQDEIITANVVITPVTSSSVLASTNKTVSTYNSTYDANNNVSIWQITQLKNKEMKVEAEFESSSKGKQVYTSSTFNDENKNSDISTTGSSKIIFSVNK